MPFKVAISTLIEHPQRARILETPERMACRAIAGRSCFEAEITAFAAFFATAGMATTGVSGGEHLDATAAGGNTSLC